MFKKVIELIEYIEEKKGVISEPSLNNMRELIKLFDISNSFKIIHVAGTNGKGSVVAYINNVLLKNNYNVGKFVSPYIKVFNERICYNDIPISDSDLLLFGNLIIEKYPLIEGLGLKKPTFFEFITILALLYFSSLKKIDFVILEVGLGGVFDPTNVVMPILTVITSISFDHMQYLGNTLEDIAINKLGILKKNVPLITLDNLSINNIVIKKAEITLSEVIFVKKEDVKKIKNTISKTTFIYKNKKYSLSMLGKYQVENACLAIEAINELIRKDFVNLKNVKRYLLETKWPGRLEVVSKKPIVILDGAHNLDAIIKLGEFITDIRKTKKVRIIFAVSRDKEVEKMIAEVEKHADEIIFTKINNVRSAEPKDLFDYSRHSNKKNEVNFEKILKIVSNDDNYINVFCGSLYFIGEVRKNFFKKE